jgi:thiamine pyrophosphokinase
VRALIVAAAPAVGTAAVVARLAQESDVTIAADGGAAVCADAGVVPEVIIGDFDSLDATVRDDLAERGAVLQAYPADKDVSDLDLALEEASRRGATEALVTAAFGQRLDHTLAAVGSLARYAPLRPELVEPDAHGWTLSPGGRDTLLLREPNATFSIIALDGAATVTATGVRWPLEDAALPPLSSWAMSNVTESADARVSVSSGTILVLTRTTRDVADRAR